MVIRSEGFTETAGMVTIYRQGSENHIVVPLPVVAWWDVDIETNAVTLHLTTGDAISVRFDLSAVLRGLLDILDGE